VKQHIVPAALTLVAVLTSACGGGSSSGSGSGSGGASGVSSSSGQVGPGFYRHQNERAVYNVAKSKYCIVSGIQQMEAFGGFKIVRVVDQSVDLAIGKMAPAFCAWPDGTYETPGSSVAFRVTGDTVCRIPNAHGLADVRMVPTITEIQFKKRFTQDCR
jgi:hypothetical protein